MIRPCNDMRRLIILFFFVAFLNVAFLHVVVMHGHDPVQTDETVVFIQPNQPDALGVSALHRNPIDAGAYQRTARTDQHGLVIIADLDCADHTSVAV